MGSLAGAKKLLLAALLASLLFLTLARSTIQQKVVDRCTCFEKGNYYSPISNSNCRSFTQRTVFHPTVQHNCSAGLQFDVNTCVCNWPSQVRCPSGCPIPATVRPPHSESCYQYGNTYTPVAGSNCTKFTQATAHLPARVHSCPGGLQFDVRECVCNYPRATSCRV